MRKSSLLQDNHNNNNGKEDNLYDSSSALSSTTTKTSQSNDILTDKERILFNDEYDNVIVSKRDPESANPVRVGTMDYFVPEKLPQVQISSV